MHDDSTAQRRSHRGYPLLIGGHRAPGGCSGVAGSLHPHRTYVRIGPRFAYVAFVVDAFSRRLVRWQISNSLRSDLALDALEQAITERLGDEGERLVHHSDRGVQYLSIRYTERLALAGIEPSVGSRGDSYDNALAETMIGLYKTELVYPRGPWQSLEDVELAT
ncbi:MAG TPA: hypothetical protein EYQ27_11065, partial [Gemmatimonadetes bacterium]|nr:hypothetical protein [Gemmatimonadota bacterium]